MDTMTMAWHLAVAGEDRGDRRRHGRAPGIDQEVHEAGIAPSLAHLASYREGTPCRSAATRDPCVVSTTRSNTHLVTTSIAALVSPPPG
jgi:hypothetical protein